MTCKTPFALLFALAALGLVGCPTATPGDDDDSTGSTDDDDDSTGSTDDDDATSANCDGVDTVAGMDVELQSFVTGLSSPTFATHAGDGTGRLFVTEQGGTLKVVDTSGGATTWLDLRNQVSGTFELGLLSVAFHPNFPTNGRVFVYYSANNDDSTVSEFTVTGDPLTDAPDANSERVLLTQPQPAGNHNGGQMAFGPDGFLYIGLGDGGGGGDQFGNGQREDTFLSKILRIDVDGTAPYGIPSDNPFIGVGNHRDETWAWGLRNPWRFSFDRETGDLWIGDVGQGNQEEVDLGVAGANYGWPQMEGDQCYTAGCDPSAFEAPVYTYPRSQGISITGGYVYRGCKMPDLHGIYFYSDYNYFNSPLYTLEGSGSSWSDGPIEIGQVGGAISSFGEDEQGEIYAVDHTSGRLLKVVPASR
jgi:glucose/arabinose dehydrogenase